MDHDVLNNYRPVSKLTTFSKIFENCILKPLNDHRQRNGHFASYQSAYRPFHSCETALIKIYSDVSEDLISELCVVMTFLVFSSAFHTVDHNILIRRLKTEFGVGGIALNWFKSYLSNRNYKVKFNDIL